MTDTPDLSTAMKKTQTFPIRRRYKYDGGLLLESTKISSKELLCISHSSEAGIQLSLWPSLRKLIIEQQIDATTLQSKLSLIWKQMWQEPFFRWLQEQICLFFLSLTFKVIHTGSWLQPKKWGACIIYLYTTVDSPMSLLLKLTECCHWEQENLIQQGPNSKAAAKAS